MGYDTWVDGGEFEITADKIPALIKRINESLKWEITTLPELTITIDEAYEFAFIDDGEAIIGIQTSEDWTRASYNAPELFNIIAPFVTHGSEIVMSGQEEAHWKYAFGDGIWDEIWPYDPVYPTWEENKLERENRGVVASPIG